MLRARCLHCHASLFVSLTTRETLHDLEAVTAMVVSDASAVAAEVGYCVCLGRRIPTPFKTVVLELRWGCGRGAFV